MDSLQEIAKFQGSLLNYSQRLITHDFNDKGAFWKIERKQSLEKKEPQSKQSQSCVQVILKEY